MSLYVSYKARIVIIDLELSLNLLGSKFVNKLGVKVSRRLQSILAQSAFAYYNVSRWKCLSKDFTRQQSFLACKRGYLLQVKQRLEGVLREQLKYISLI